MTRQQTGIRHETTLPGTWTCNERERTVGAEGERERESKPRAARGKAPRGRPKSGESSGVQSLVLTGELRDRHYKVQLDGADVWFSFANFSTFCRLVHARLTTDDGQVKLDKHAVRHLRDALNQVRDGWGHVLISSVPGEKQCYALLWQRDEIRIDPSVEQVRLTACIPKEILDAIVAVAAA